MISSEGFIIAAVSHTTMFRVILAALGLIVIVMGMSCGSSGPAAPGSANDSPTEAYKRLYAAVKGKDTEAIKRELTEKSLDLAKIASATNNTPIDKVYLNGFTETTFSPTLPEIRDQRVAGDQGAIEVWNSKKSIWEDLPFIKVDGAWKFAIGDLFAGTFNFATVGRGRSFKEAEAANAAGKGPLQGPSSPNSNIVANTGPTVAPLANAKPEKRAK